jgi:antitoxin component YwqK of YwqJK toxin-antitoxin module
MSQSTALATPASSGETQNGVVLHHHPNGNPCCESTFVDGRKNGPGKMFYRDYKGKVYAEETWKAGKLDGLTKLFYPNGTLQAELQYKADLLDGLAKEYFPTGELSTEVNYTAGKRDGTTTVYDETGKKICIEEYRGGVMTKAPITPVEEAPAAEATTPTVQ